jgi:hypothetical protein
LSNISELISDFIINNGKVPNIKELKNIKEQFNISIDLSEL